MARPSSDALISPEEIAARIEELAAMISNDFSQDGLAVIIVLKGAVYFGADLARAISIPIAVDFVRVRSYQGTERVALIDWLLKPTEPLSGKDVLIVEDVLDTGHTARAVVDYVEAAGAASVALCTLLNKPDRRLVDIQPDYNGFTIQDTFVVGYGLDLYGQYRELPGIHMLTHG